MKHLRNALRIAVFLPFAPIILALGLVWLIAKLLSEGIEYLANLPWPEWMRLE